MENTGVIAGNKRKFLFAIVGLLALLNAVLFFMNWTMNQENKLLKANNREIEKTKNNLQTAYQESLASLSKFKGENNRLDSLLNLNTTELENQKAEIKALLENKKLTMIELAQAKTLISNLKLKTQTKVNTMDSLYAISQQLANTNSMLKEDLITERTVSDQLVDATKILEAKNDTLEVKTQQLEEEKEAIAAEAEKLQEEKENLETTNDKLEDKITRAAILKTSNINVKGIRFKNNGKEKPTKDFKKVEKIKICYEVLDNQFAQNGIKELLFKITHPEGFILAVEETGSGNFIDSNDENMQFTTSADIDYRNSEAQGYCTYWAYDAELSPGIYLTQIYHRGYLVGESSFELRNTLF